MFTSCLSNFDDKFRQLYETIQSCGPFEPSPVLAVAVSGGPDSMALCLLAQQWAQENGGRVIALTVDHGLRKESAAEAAQVQAWLRAKNIEHYILRWKGEKPDTALQEKAREARYALLTEWCRQKHVWHLLVAHTRDDQAETFLLRNTRGSGPHGLACMKPLSERNGVRILRPLLNTPKKMLADFLRARNQKWMDDCSNRNENFMRVKLRRELAQRGEAEIQHLHKQAQHFGTQRAAEEMRIAALLARHAQIFPQGYARLNFTGAEQEKLLPCMLASLLRAVSGNPYPPRSKDLERLLQALKQGVKKATLGGCIFAFSQRRKEEGWLSIYRETKWAKEEIAVSGTGEWLWDRRFAVKIEILPSFPDFVSSLHSPTKSSLSLPTSPKLRRTGEGNSRPVRRSSKSEDGSGVEGKNPASHSIRALGRKGYLQIKAEIRDLPRIAPKMALYTLPALWHLDSVAAVPHIHYEQPAFSGICMTAAFRPAVALAPEPFMPSAENCINA